LFESQKIASFPVKIQQVKQNIKPLFNKAIATHFFVLLQRRPSYRTKSQVNARLKMQTSIDGLPVGGQMGLQVHCKLPKSHFSAALLHLYVGKQY